MPSFKKNLREKVAELAERIGQTERVGYWSEGDISNDEGKTVLDMIKKNDSKALRAKQSFTLESNRRKVSLTAYKVVLTNEAYGDYFKRSVSGYIYFAVYRKAHLVEIYRFLPRGLDRSFSEPTMSEFIEWLQITSLEESTAKLFKNLF